MAFDPNKFFVVLTTTAMKIRDFCQNKENDENSRLL